jgi:hypothetical protein
LQLIKNPEHHRRGEIAGKVDLSHLSTYLCYVGYSAGYGWFPSGGALSDFF